MSTPKQSIASNCVKTLRKLCTLICILLTSLLKSAGIRQSTPNSTRAPNCTPVTGIGAPTLYVNLPIEIKECCSQQAGLHKQTKTNRGDIIWQLQLVKRGSNIERNYFNTTTSFYLIAFGWLQHGWLNNTCWHSTETCRERH